MIATVASNYIGEAMRAAPAVPGTGKPAIPPEMTAAMRKIDKIP